MSREEKLAFMKKLKEERKALYVELGIEEETKQTKAQKEAEAAAEAAAAQKAESERLSAAAQPPPTQLPGFNAAFKCLGFVFSMNLNVTPAASEGEIDSEKTAATDAIVEPSGGPRVAAANA